MIFFWETKNLGKRVGIFFHVNGFFKVIGQLFSGEHYRTDGIAKGAYLKNVFIGDIAPGQACPDAPGIH